MRIPTRRSFTAVLAALLALLVAELPLARQDAGALLSEGQKLLRSGDRLGAQQRFEQAVKSDPKSYDAHYGLGRVLDLNGAYAEARRHFEHALALAPEENHAQPLNAIAVSYAFEGRPDESARFYQRVFDAQSAAKDPEAAATANAIARVYLEAGDLGKAEEWYRTGRETARNGSGLKPEQIDLMEFRWLHAQARLASRRNDAATAHAHMREARKVLDKGTNPDQVVQFPYLAGYVAFHTGDFKTAIKEFEAADQEDPFILGLMAQAYDRIGNKGRARELFRKVLATPAHTINAAYSWPIAKKYLGEK
jgi:tetratricopeptide (TPR) repeat protein